MNIILPKHHFSITSSTEVAAVCKPLFANSLINYYWYAKLYPNGKYVSLSTNGSWNQHIFDNEQYLQPNQLIPGKHLVSSFSPDKSADASNLFNLNHLFVIIEKFQNHYEFTGYASNNKNTEVIDYYFNKPDTLNKFNIYFKHRANNLIKISEKNPIMLPNFTNHKLEHNIKAKDKLTDIIETTSPLKDAKTKLTKREKECVYHLAHGRSFKEIANIFSISHRTVETHLAKAKIKLKCCTKSQLVSKVWDEGLLI